MITINFRSIPTLIANHHFLYLQLEKVEFTFIGPEWGDDDGNENGNDHGDGGKDNNGAAGNSPGGDKKPKSAAQLEGEVMVGELVAATEGLMCTMEVILDKSNVYLSFGQSICAWVLRSSSVPIVKFTQPSNLPSVSFNFRTPWGASCTARGRRRSRSHGRCRSKWGPTSGSTPSDTSSSAGSRPRRGSAASQSRVR